jgi:hypothetical protein
MVTGRPLPDVLSEKNFKNLNAGHIFPLLIHWQLIEVPAIVTVQLLRYYDSRYHPLLTLESTTVPFPWKMVMGEQGPLRFHLEVAGFGRGK